MSTSSMDEPASPQTVVESGPGAHRVAFLIHDLRPGGAERVFVTYVNGAEAIAPVAVVVRRRRGIEKELLGRVPLFDLGSRASARVARPLPDEVTDAAGGASTVSTLVGPWSLTRKAFRLRRVLEAEGIGTVSTFLHKSHAIALFLKLIVSPELKVIVNVHEMPSQHIPHHFGALGRALMTLMTRFVLPRADLIVAVTGGVRDDLVETFGVPAERVEIVPNPIPLDRIREAARAPVDHPFFAADGGPIVIGVGRMVPLKGFHVLLEAMATMPEDLGARLVLVGEGPERTTLESRSRALGLGDRVAFIGYDPNPWRFMARADVLALPSLTEALPMVVAEALALGIPVVASACSPGVSEYLQGGRAGILVTPGDPSELAGALEPLLRDPEARGKLAERAEARGRELPGPDQVRHYERTVLTALAGRRAS